MATEKKVKNPRKVRTYKVVDAVYKKAMARAKKEKCKMSNVIENFVTEYAGISTTKVDLQKVVEPFAGAD
jgi:hypothetical protein